jgi:hypothetical protein
MQFLPPSDLLGAGLFATSRLISAIGSDESTESVWGILACQCWPHTLRSLVPYTKLTSIRSFYSSCVKAGKNSLLNDTEVSEMVTRACSALKYMRTDISRTILGFHGLLPGHKDELLVNPPNTAECVRELQSFGVDVNHTIVFSRVLCYYLLVAHQWTMLSSSISHVLLSRGGMSSFQFYFTKMAAAIAHTIAKQEPLTFLIQAVQHDGERIKGIRLLHRNQRQKFPKGFRSRNGCGEAGEDELAKLVSPEVCTALVFNGIIRYCYFV